LFLASTVDIISLLCRFAVGVQYSGASFHFV